MLKALRQYLQSLQHLVATEARPFYQPLIPSCRQMTTGERALAQSIFGDALALDQVQLCSSHLILRHYAMSPNGSVYFHPADFVADFSQASLHTQAWLVHELTHVWQVQQGIKVLRRALLNRRYRYVLQEGKTFLEYGVEQQAQMVQDWFLKQAQGLPCDDLQACIPFTRR